MSEGKSNKSWGAIAIYKLVEYAGIALLVWKLVLPAADKWYEEQREAYDKKHHKVSFRQLLSEETEIPQDRLHIVWGKFFKDQEEHDKLIESVWPLLEEEMNSIIPRLIITDGSEFWVAEDGDYYRVHRDAIDNRGSYYKNNKWNYIYW